MQGGLWSCWQAQRQADKAVGLSAGLEKVWWACRQVAKYALRKIYRHVKSSQSSRLKVQVKIQNGGQIRHRF